MASDWDLANANSRFLALKRTRTGNIQRMTESRPTVHQITIKGITLNEICFDHT